MIKIAFSTLGSPKYDVDQVVALARDSGYDGVEIRFIRNEVDLPSLAEFSPAGLPETRGKLDAAGIAVACVDTSIKISTRSDADLAAQLELARIQTDIALGVGSPYIRVFGGPEPGDPDVAGTLPSIAAGLSAIADLTAARGVTTIVETHGTLSKTSSMLEVFEHGVSENLGVLWDVLHTYRHGESLADAYSAVSSRLKHVHLKDSAGMVATDKDFVLTGEGVLPIDEAIAILVAAEYSGYVSFEWEKYWAPAIAEPEVAIPQFASYVLALPGVR